MKKTFPEHPATVEIYDTQGITMEVTRELEWGPISGEPYPILASRDYGDHMRHFTVLEVVSDFPSFLELKTTEGFRVIVRPYGTYDAVRSGHSNIPWPKTVMLDYLDEGDDAMSLVALVDDNGDVATLMLTSSSAMHLRFSAQWILLTDLEMISDYSVVMVEDTALDMFDPADQAGMSVKIVDMPVKPEEGFRVTVAYSGDQAPADLVTAAAQDALTASGASIPIISAATDMVAAVEFASDHPEFQWYVERRSHALGLSYEFPWG